jgi:hypothetical protein
MEWINMAQDKIHWNVVTNEVMNLCSLKANEFDQLSAYQIFKRLCLI